MSFALGVALAGQFPLLGVPLACLLAASCLVARRPFRGRWPLVVLLLGMARTGGALHHQASVENAQAEHLDDRDLEVLTGVVEGLPEDRGNRQQLRLRTRDARIWLTIYATEGRPPPRLLPGQRLEVFARLKRPVGLRGAGTFPRQMYVMGKGAELEASASLDDVQVLSADTRLLAWPVRLHRWAVQQVAERRGGAAGKGMVAALATGDRELLPDELAPALRTAGIAHLLAVSGMHLAALVTLVFVVAGRLWSLSPWCDRLEPKNLAAGSALVVALAFTLMTGARPSTCRAFLVAALVLIGILGDRRMPLLHALALAASGLLLWRPTWLFDAGFQMSFAAAGALSLALARDDRLRFESRGLWARLRRALLALLRASFWATLATAPIALHHFGECSPWGLVSNLVAVPLATLLLLPLSVAGLLLVAVAPPAGEILLSAAIAVGDGLARLCLLATAGEAPTPRPPMSALELGCWALAVAALLFRWPRRKTASGAALVVFTLSRLYAADVDSQRRDALRVTFVEIGQGDAALIELPGGENWLVDGGGMPFVAGGVGADRQHIAEAPARQALLPLLRHRRIEAIDLVVVSHPHPDHYVGLQAVARRMPIRELWSAHEERAEEGPYQQWLRRLQREGTRVVRPALGAARSEEGAALHVLWPRYEAEGGVARSDPVLTVNDNSLVVRLDFGGRRILFAGDIEEEAEELLVAEHPDELRADVVKVAHHGSPTSSTAAFVAAIQPSLAVISCGLGNRFDFPAKEVEERWQRDAELLLRTDRVGSITVEIDADGSLRVETVAPFWP